MVLFGRNRVAVVKERRQQRGEQGPTRDLFRRSGDMGTYLGSSNKRDRTSPQHEKNVQQHVFWCGEIYARERQWSGENRLPVWAGKDRVTLAFAPLSLWIWTVSLRNFIDELAADERTVVLRLRLPKNCDSQYASGLHLQAACLTCTVRNTAPESIFYIL